VNPERTRTVVGSACTHPPARRRNLDAISSARLDQLLVELDDIASPRQKFLAGLAEGLPLYGEPLIERWQKRLRDYPENFRREMIRRHWNFFPLWYYGEAMAPPEAAQSFGALVEETRQLVGRELPDLELPLPFPPGTRQRPWALD
jgi:hypothetical protein